MSAVGSQALAGLRTAWAWLVATYATVDPRSLGLCRILLGLLIFADVARRYRDLDAYYTNLGWLANHFSLYQPMSKYVFSLYHAFSTPEEVRVLFFFHCFINLLFLVGYKTRWTHLLAFILLTSLNSRNIIIENGGFVMLALLALWTWFLPMGQRLSVDAWLASWRIRREKTLEELNDRARPRLSVAPVTSLAVTIVILQWAINYYLNTVHKNGPTWHDGTAIYYFVQQARLLHPFGVWLGDNTPLWVIKALTHGTLIVEGTIAYLWISPIFSKAARMLAWVLGVSLHMGIFMYATLGPFVWIMMIPYAMFIPREAWEWARRRSRVRRRRLELLLDPRSPVALLLGRIAKRLDVLELVRFGVAKTKGQRRQLAVVVAGDGQTVVGAGAVKHLLQVLPGPLWGLKLAAPFLARVCAWGVSRFLARPKVWSRRLALDAGAPHHRASSPASRVWARSGHWLGTALLVVLFAVSVSQVLIENRAIPKWMKPNGRPEWVEQVVTYPRLFQGWSMFAPDPPREDGWVVVDGRTVDGRKLDPLTGKEPNFSLDLPFGPDFSAQWEAFHMRIHEKRFAVYHPGFETYLKNYYKISGNPADELVSFDVWYVKRFIHPPGHGFSEPKRQKLFSHGVVNAGKGNNERARAQARGPVPAGQNARGRAARPGHPKAAASPHASALGSAVAAPQPRKPRPAPATEASKRP